ncbi:MAG TPA: hypothetical protein VL020_03360, partial [Pseudomonadales bacterium]|nr:hypothetical protein [Pseudomonadales bacterium]
KAFAESDKVLAQSVKTVVDLILVPAVINLDFADVKNTLLDSGIALIGFGQGSGKNKARDAAQAAINSPLLEASLQGARKAIVSVTCGTNVSLYEAQETVNSIIETSGSNVDVKFGVALNDLLEDDIIVSIIASDFEEEYDFTRPGPTQPPIALPQDYVAPDHEEDDDIIDIFPDFLREQEDEFPN